MLQLDAIEQGLGALLRRLHDHLVGGFQPGDQQLLKQAGEGLGRSGPWQAEPLYRL